VDKEDIFSRIKKWAERNGKPLDEFYQKRTLPDRSDSVRRQEDLGMSRLAFEALENDDLRRIMVPMDVVLKLSRPLR
jgi:hypothetical protein